MKKLVFRSFKNVLFFCDICGESVPRFTFMDKFILKPNLCSLNKKEMMRRLKIHIFIITSQYVDVVIFDCM